MPLAHHIELNRRVVQMEHTFEERQVDRLADTGLLAIVKRSAYRSESVDAGVFVSDEQSHIYRRAVRIAGQMHQAAHRQGDCVVADAMLEGTVLPEPRN